MSWFWKLRAFVDNVVLPLADCLLLPFLLHVVCLGLSFLLFWCVKAAGEYLATSTYEYFFTLQDPDTLFLQNFLVLFGWISLLVAVWWRAGGFFMRNMVLLSLVPLCFNFGKVLIFYISPIFNPDAPIINVLSFDQWKEMMKNPYLVVAFTENFFAVDLCLGALLLFHYKKFVWFGDFRARLWMTVILLVTVNVCPTGLLAYTISVFFFEQKKLFFPLVVLFLSIAAYDPSILQLRPPQVIFYQTVTLLVGWVGLLLWLVSNKLRKVAGYLFTLSFLIPCYNYTLILFIHGIPVFDFINVTAWITGMQDEYILSGGIVHVAISITGTGYLLLTHFYANYPNFSATVVGKLFFLIVLATLFAVSPVGILLYIVSCWYLLPNEEPPPPPILDKRPVYIGETWPEFVRTVFFFAKAVVGLLCALFLASLYLLFVLYCFWKSKLFGLWEPLGTENPTFQQFPPPSSIVPNFVRRSASQMRVHLLANPQRGFGISSLIWFLKFHFLQFAAVIEIGPDANTPNNLSGMLGYYYGGVFPFGDGIGFGDRKKVIEYLRDPECRKGPRSLAGPVSSVQREFCYLSTITLGLAPPDQGDKVIRARKVLQAWLQKFDFNRAGLSNPAFEALASKFPRINNGKLPSDSEIHSVFGDVLYWMATPASTGNPNPAYYPVHGQFSREEKGAYTELVDNLFQFFPDWINFLLGGGYMERRANDAFYKMRNAFYRDQGVAYEAAMQAAREQNISDSEALRLIVSVFAIAGAAVPAKVTAAIIKRIMTNPALYIDMYQTNPDIFIKECARLDPAVFWVNLITHKNETINGIVIPPGTPCHLYIPFAHLDPEVFPNPLNFDPFPPNVDPVARISNIMTWNAMEHIWTEKPFDSQSYPRFCPGHDVAIRAMRLVVDHYVRQMECVNAHDSYEIEKNLDQTTKNALLLTNIRVNNWSEHSSFQMNHFVKRGLRVTNYPPFRLPTWDEDYLNRLTPLYDFAAQCATLIPVSDYFWTAPDRAADAWRRVNLPAFPQVNVDYHDEAGNFNSDELVSRLAFYGLSCHRTTLVEAKDRTPQKKYVNDTSALRDFPVRHGFAGYGAKAYFDSNYLPSEIEFNYWKQGGPYVVTRPDDPKTFDPMWEQAKWVWKVSMFTLVTLLDHLMVCHLVKAGAFVQASREHLPPDHILRVIFKPFTFHTIYINALAGKTLYCPNGLAARVWAFTDVTGVLDSLKQTYHFSQDFVGLAGEDTEHYPIETDYTSLLGIITKYVSSSVALIDNFETDVAVRTFYDNLVRLLIMEENHPWFKFNPENFIALISHLIQNGTAIHEQVGQISDYQILPSLTGAKVVDSILEYREPAQSYAINTALTSSTGIKQPMLLDNWRYLFDRISDQGKKIKAVQDYDEFKSQLLDLSLQIFQRNKDLKNQKHEFKNFDPRTLNCSVSK